MSNDCNHDFEEPGPNGYSECKLCRLGRMELTLEETVNSMILGGDDGFKGRGIDEIHVDQYDNYIRRN